MGGAYCSWNYCGGKWTPNNEIGPDWDYRDINHSLSGVSKYSETPDFVFECGTADVSVHSFEDAFEDGYAVVLNTFSLVWLVICPDLPNLLSLLQEFRVIFDLAQVTDVFRGRVCDS